MLDQAVSIPQGEVKEVGHYFSFVSTVVRSLIIVPICWNSCFSMSLRSCYITGLWEGLRILGSRGGSRRMLFGDLSVEVDPEEDTA
jgi:hypothetical protein